MHVAVLRRSSICVLSQRACNLQFSLLPPPPLVLINDNRSCCSSAPSTAPASVGRLFSSSSRAPAASLRVSSMQQQQQPDAATSSSAPAVPTPPTPAARPQSPPIPAPPGCLQAKQDMYGGVIVEPAPLQGMAAAEFRSQLGASLEHWHGLGKRGVWLKLSLADAALVPVAGEQGFAFHHAEPDYVMMTRWLPTDVPSTIPENASHQVGIGAFVLNDAGEVLVVQEASGPLKGRGVWKMPTGLVSQGEDFTEAAEREVLEETGVVAKFESVLALRQAHGFAFGKSDLFVLIAMRAAPGPQAISHQETELVAAQWMPVEEMAGQEFYQGMQLYMKMLDRCRAWAAGRYRGLSAAKLESSFISRRMDLLVWGDDDAKAQ